MITDLKYLLSDVETKENILKERVFFRLLLVVLEGDTMWTSRPQRHNANRKLRLRKRRSSISVNFE